MAGEDYADLAIRSKSVFTAQTHHAFEGVVLVKGNKIMEVYPKGAGEEYIGPNTQVIDADNGTVLPGFNDAHTHLLQAGVMLDKDYTIDLTGLTSKEAVLGAIDEFAKSHPENEWVVGCNFDWNNKEFEPDKWMLDELLPDRPAYFASNCMHVGWTNSLALEAAGYNRDTADPEGGLLVRNEDGELIGIGKEPPVNDPVWGIANSAANMDRALGNMISEAISCGVTATGVVWPYGGIPEKTCMGVFKDFKERGKLPIRVTVFPKLEEGLENAKTIESEFTGDWLRFGGVKQIVDGMCESHTGYLLEPYADQPNTCGEPAMPKETLKELIAEADAQGYPVRLHAIGNGTVHMVLDCFEEVGTEQGFKGLHNCIEHYETATPEDMVRTARMGIVPSMQPIHSILNVEGYPKLLGEKWIPYMWPLRSLIDLGAIPAFGTDSPVWKLNPMEGIYAAVTRQQPWDGKPEGGFVPEQRITVAEALQAYTFGAARAESFEDRIGTLHAGKLADITVMNTDLLSATPEEILDAKVLFTVIDGKIAYQACAD